MILIPLLVAALASTSPAIEHGYIIKTAPSIDGETSTIEALSRRGTRAILMTPTKTLYSWDIEHDKVRKVVDLRDAKLVKVAGFLDDDRFVITIDRRQVKILTISGESVDIPGPAGPFEYFWVDRCEGKFGIGSAYDEELDEESSLVWNLEKHECVVFRMLDAAGMGDPRAFDINVKGEIVGAIGSRGVYRHDMSEVVVDPHPDYRYCLFESIGRSGRVGGVLNGRVPFLWNEETGFVRLFYGSSLPEITRVYDINDMDQVLGSMKGSATNGQQEAVIWNGQEPSVPFLILGNEAEGLDHGDYFSSGKTISNDGKILAKGVFQGKVGSRLLVPKVSSR